MQMRKIIISEKLKLFRCQNRITQKDLADLMGITARPFGNGLRGNTHQVCQILLRDAILATE